MERLDKILSGDGRWSRKEVRQLVRAGRVTVDGVTADSPEQKCARSQRFFVDGQPVFSQAFTYIMLYKPAGVLSATQDSRQPTVLDLLPPEISGRELFPVGRLDKDTVGLLLLTNDGALAHRLLSPKNHVDKVYYAKVDGRLCQRDVECFAQGIPLADGLVCMPAKLEVLEDGHACKVTLHEGKFHQVKRMLEWCGAPVVFLKRLSMGSLRLDPTLAPGEWRELTQAEIAEIFQR